MPSLSVKFTGDASNLDATYARVKATSSAAVKEFQRQKDVEIQSEISALDARVAAHRKASQEIAALEKELMDRRLRNQALSHQRDESHIREQRRAAMEMALRGSASTSFTDHNAPAERDAREQRRADATAAFGGPITLNEKQNAYLKRKREMGMGGGSSMAPGFAKLLATESAIIGGQGGAAAATGWFANFANNLKGHGSGGMQQLMHVGRATFDSLASGMSPWRVMLQQAPQALQAFASMTGSMLTKIVGVIFNPITLGAAAAVSAIAAGGYFIYRYFTNLAAGLENVGERFGLARASMSEMREEMVKSGDAARDFTKWMHSLAGATMSVADKTAILLKRLREQFQLEQEIAKMKGASPQKLLGMELDQLQKEQDVVNRARELAYEKKAIHEKEVQDAEKSIADSGKDRVAAQHAEAASALAAKFGDAIREKLNLGPLERQMETAGANSLTSREIIGSNPMTGQSIFAPAQTVEEKLKALSNTIVDIDVDGKHFHGSLAQAQREMDGYNATAKKLRDVQAELATLLEKKKNLTQQDRDSIISLGKQEADLISAMNLKQQYGPTIAAGGGAAGSRDLTANQRIGAFAMPGQTTMVDLTRQIVKQTTLTNTNLEKLLTKPAGDASGYGS
jgi:hypothetical protein